MKKIGLSRVHSNPTKFKFNSKLMDEAVGQSSCRKMTEKSFPCFKPFYTACCTTDQPVVDRSHNSHKHFVYLSTFSVLSFGALCASGKNRDATGGDLSTTGAGSYMRALCNVSLLK
ncbi:hypothetical protein L596_000979 [Steinernema carpocapsae]|uniref:Uncharacterized protein n=1 Tax=Steinernema carpocapsae TaxID=34508 RepID=A0A4U8UK99_STECR|nr:hypothetical protein L596_000979 [Steinernema carpocapsae]